MSIVMRGFWKDIVANRDFQLIAEALISQGKRILDIGCGIGDYLKYTSADQIVHAVEPHAPYIEKAKEKYPWVKFHNCDGIQFFENNLEHFDVIVMFDVLEHLCEDKAIELLERAKNQCNVIVAQIPIGDHHQDEDIWGLGGEFWQTHRSIWTEDNIGKLGFSYYQVWKEWYNWEDSSKSCDTSICFWTNSFENNGLEIFVKRYLEFLNIRYSNAWQLKASNEVAKRNLNHYVMDYYYIFDALDFDDVLSLSRSFVEIWPGEGAFFDSVFSCFSRKECLLIELNELNNNLLSKKYSHLQNVTVTNDFSSLSNGKHDFMFSFLLCQHMPPSLWRNHLCQVKQALGENGVYYFQFIDRRNEKSCNDTIADAIEGIVAYSLDEISNLLRDAGFSGCDISIPYFFQEGRRRDTWYLVKAY